MTFALLSTSLICLLAFTSRSTAQSCNITFNGRLPGTATPAVFDLESSPYKNKFVLGQNTTFGELIKIPTLYQQCMFDCNAKAFEITIDDKSIFAPSADNVQVGFRRAELIPNLDNNSTTGVKTLHWSLRTDSSRPLNLTHEYGLVFLERGDYSGSQFTLKAGTVSEIFAKDPNMDPKTLYLQGNAKDWANTTTLFKTPLIDDVFHNFAMLMDFNKNLTQIYYSVSDTPLTPATGHLPNDLSGNGEYHIGLLKKPTGENLTDVTKQGFQQSNLNEGIIYGGIFQEDSAQGCISVTPRKTT